MYQSCTGTLREPRHSLGQVKTVGAKLSNQKSFSPKIRSESVIATREMKNDIQSCPFLWLIAPAHFCLC